MKIEIGNGLRQIILILLFYMFLIIIASQIVQCVKETDVDRIKLNETELKLKYERGIK